jgi:hypothetical protein
MPLETGITVLLEQENQIVLEKVGRFPGLRALCWQGTQLYSDRRGSMGTTGSLSPSFVEASLCRVELDCAALSRRFPCSSGSFFRSSRGCGSGSNHCASERRKGIYPHPPDHSRYPSLAYSKNTRWPTLLGRILRQFTPRGSAYLSFL